MRRSTMWFLIAGFWLVDGGMVLYRHRLREGAVALAAVLVFAVIGAGWRRAEAKKMRERGL